MEYMTLDQFTIAGRGGRPIFMFTERIGATMALARQTKAELSLSRESPFESRHNVEMLDGLINPLSLLAYYFKLRCEMGAFTNRFLLQLSNKADEKSKCL